MRGESAQLMQCMPMSDCDVSTEKGGGTLDAGRSVYFITGMSKVDGR